MGMADDMLQRQDALQSGADAVCADLGLDDLLSGLASPSVSGARRWA